MTPFSASIDMTSFSLKDFSPSPPTHDQYCPLDTSGKIRFTSRTSGQVVSTGQTNLPSGEMHLISSLKGPQMPVLTFPLGKKHLICQAPKQSRYT